MEQFLQERPELNNHVHGLKEDIAGLIKVLSEKLTTTNDIDAAIDDEVSLYDIEDKVSVTKGLLLVKTMVLAIYNNISPNRNPYPSNLI